MSRRKRVLLWAGLLVVAAGVGLTGVWQLVARGPHPRLAGYQRIQPGMTRAAVEACIGPPGDWSTRTVWVTLNDSPPGALPEEGPTTEPVPESWIWDWGVINVYFDENGRVTGKGIQNAFPEPGQQTFLEKARVRLGLAMQ